MRLKSVQLTLSKDANACNESKKKISSDDDITALCHFSANDLAIELTQFVNEAMLMDFRLGDVVLIDRREQSQGGINKIIRGYVVINVLNETEFRKKCAFFRM